MQIACHEFIEITNESLLYIRNLSTINITDNHIIRIIRKINRIQC